MKQMFSHCLFIPSPGGPMIPFKPQKDLPTHEVLNMPPHLGDQDLWMSDPALRDGVVREGGSWAEEKLAKLGKPSAVRKFWKRRIRPTEILRR